MLTQAHEIVDLSKIKKLNDNHLKIHLKYHNKETDPVMYGNKFPYGTASKPTLVDRKDIKWRGGRFQTYQSRFGNGNTKLSRFGKLMVIKSLFNKFICCIITHIETSSLNTKKAPSGAFSHMLIRAMI